MLAVFVVIFEAVVIALAFAFDEEEARLRNIAKMESALETFGRAIVPIRLRDGPPMPTAIPSGRWALWFVPPISLPLVCIERKPKSVSAKSELDSESLPWFDEVLCGERISFVHGDGGTELAWNCKSVGRLRALEFRVF